MAELAAALWPLSTLPFRELGTLGHLLSRGLPADAWLNSCGVYAVVCPPDYRPRYLDVATVRAAGNVLSPQTNDRLEARWIDGARVVYIGFAGNTNPRTLRQRLKDLLRHGSGDTTERGPHRGGESLWQLAGYDRFNVLVLTTGLPPEPKTVEETLLEKFRKRFGALPFGNRGALDGEPIRESKPVVSPPMHARTDGATLFAAAPQPVPPTSTAASATIERSTPVQSSPTLNIVGPKATPPTSKFEVSSMQNLMTGKSPLSAAIDQALAKAQASVVMDALKSVPDETTIRDLLKSLSDHGLGEVFLSLPIGLLRGSAGAAAVAPKPTMIAAEPDADDDESDDDEDGSPSRERMTRTQSGRDALDRDIKEVLKREGRIKAEELRHEVGGTPTQIRDSLKRLMAAHLVRVEGERRATVYIWFGDK